jgi:hypothetical protein
MRQMLAISLGLSPLNYKEWFQEQYPALAQWIKTCACNRNAPQKLDQRLREFFA